MAKTKFCKDCVPTSKRPAPYPGPRCATHNREQRAKTKKAAHDRHLMQTYGISGDEYQAIYEFQGGVCAICRRAKGLSRKLSVDHDHRLGPVREANRGLLCLFCNRDVLGHLRDDAEALLRAVEYLRNPPARIVLGLGVGVTGISTEDGAPE